MVERLLIPLLIIITIGVMRIVLSCIPLHGKKNGEHAHLLINEIRQIFLYQTATD